MFNKLIYIGLLMYVMAQSCFVFCLLCFALFVFLSLSILLVMLTILTYIHWWSRYSIWQPAIVLFVVSYYCFIILANIFSLWPSWVGWAG